LSSASLDQTLKLITELTNKNSISEDDDWEKNISKFGWLPKHVKLFNEAVKILDSDRLARMTIGENKQNQMLQTNVVIDRSADRLRKAFSSIACWDIALISWLQTLLMENLPPSYLASFIDILQTLKHKIPSLIDKILFWKPGCINNDLVGMILKKRWQPTLNYKVIDWNYLI
jgi:regulatory NSL complex subunit 3